MWLLTVKIQIVIAATYTTLSKMLQVTTLVLFTRLERFLSTYAHENCKMALDMSIQLVGCILSRFRVCTNTDLVGRVALDSGRDRVNPMGIGL